MTTVNDSEAMQIGPDPDKLFVYHRQQLSAMLDGELSPDEARFMLRRLQHDTELAACWEHWQVCGDVLRGRRDALLPADFAQRVARAIEGDDDAAAGQAAPRPRPRLARWSGGAAIAASVALLAVFVSRQLPEATPSAADALAPLVAEAAAPAAASPDSLPTIDAIAADAAADAGDPTPPAAPAAAAAALATAAVAVAELPRRASEQRRSRAQSQRAASRVQARQSAPAPVAVAAAAAPAPAVAAEPMPSTGLLPEATVASAPAGAAFSLPAQATDVSPRPWPRALLPGTGSAFSAGYGSGLMFPEPHAFEPFRSGEVAGLLRMPPPPAAQAEASPAEDAPPAQP